MCLFRTDTFSAVELKGRSELEMTDLDAQLEKQKVCISNLTYKSYEKTGRKVQYRFKLS